MNSEMDYEFDDEPNYLTDDGDRRPDDGRRAGAIGRARLCAVSDAGGATRSHERRRAAAVRHAAPGLFGQLPVAPRDQRL